MSVREIRTIGDPALRERARELRPDELVSPEIQTLIDEMIETKRAAHGAGIAANQVGVPVRVIVVEVEPDNPRYPYKPPFPLTVAVNPTLEPLGRKTIAIDEGCLSVPDLRGELDRHASVLIRYLDRAGNRREQVMHGLTAGTFQHEVDHIDGTLFVDRVEDPTTLATLEQFQRHRRDDFVARARAVVEQYGM